MDCSLLIVKERESQRIRESRVQKKLSSKMATQIAVGKGKDKEERMERTEEVPRTVRYQLSLFTRKSVAAPSTADRPRFRRYRFSA